MSSCLQVYLRRVQKKDTFRYTMHVPLILYIKSNNWKGQYKKIKRYPFDKRDRVKNTLLIYSVFSFSDFLFFSFFFQLRKRFIEFFFRRTHQGLLVLLHVFYRLHAKLKMTKIYFFWRRGNFCIIIIFFFTLNTNLIIW